MILNFNKTQKRIKQTMRSRKLTYEQEMAAKTLEISNLNEELKRLTAINKEWESAHMGRLQNKNSSEKQQKEQNDKQTNELKSSKAAYATLQAQLVTKDKELANNAV